MKKSEAISQAYAQIRVSGLTVNPTPEDVTVSLHELDQMMWAWAGIGRDVNYNFPPPTSGDELVISDPADRLGVEAWAIAGVVSNLAIRLVEYFGKEVPMPLNRKARSALSVIKRNTFKAVDVPYPNRMPMGRGNTFRTPYYNRYYHPAYEGRKGATDMVVDAIRDFAEDFTNNLTQVDSIDSYTIEASGGVKLVSHSQDGNVINYRLDAEQTQRGSISIEVLTTDGLVIPVPFVMT